MKLSFDVQDQDNMVAVRPTVIVNPELGFDRNLRKYKCICCQCLHITGGTIIIGVVSTIMSLLGLVWSVDCFLFVNDTLSQFDPKENAGELWPFYAVTMVVCILDIIACIFLFVAVKKEREKLLIPSLIMQVVKFLLVLAGFIMFICAAAMTDPTFRKAVINALGIARELANLSQVLISVALVLGLLIKLIMQIVWTTAELRCYKFFKEKREWSARNSIDLEHYHNLDTLPIRGKPSVENGFIWTTNNEDNDTVYY